MCSVIAVTALSAAASMASQYINYRQETKSAAASAQYNADVAADQARVSQALASQEMQKGENDRTRHLRNAARQMGDMRSQLGAGGFEMDSGSGLSMLAESAVEQQHDANIIGQNAAMNAWQHQADTNKALNQRNWYDYQRKNSKGSSTAQWLGMGGSLLGGIASGMGRTG